MQPVTLVAPTDGQRLDRFVADELPQLSRSQVKRLIQSGQVTLNGEPAKPAASLSQGDRVVVQVLAAPEAELVAEPALLDVVYEDAHLLVVNKAAGVIVHPGAGRVEGSLLAAAIAYRPDIVSANEDPDRPGIVHRLDRDTSGLILIAATADAQRKLRAQFKARQVLKIYLALIQGRLEPMVGAIEAPIARDPLCRTRMAVAADGRYARTEYRVLEHLSDATFVEVQLLTGRTHQIRVHFSAIGHPVVGDRVYGGRGAHKAAPRQFLHSHRLGFTHPASGEALEFTSPLPQDLQQVLDHLRPQPGCALGQGERPIALL